MRKVYSVFPHRSFNGVKFGVQMPKGILGFTTKKKATEVAEKLKLAFLTPCRDGIYGTGKSSCYITGCTGSVCGETPDGRKHCGVHANVMD